MTYVIWDPALEIGNDLVDTQHKQLYETINELHDAVVSGEPIEVQESILMRLMEQAESHFHDEEDLMRSIGYPGLTDQQWMHAEFMAQAQRLTEEYRSNKAVLPITLAIFLQDWLVKHTRTEDKKIGEFIRAQES